MTAVVLALVKPVSNVDTAFTIGTYLTRSYVACVCCDNSRDTVEKSLEILDIARLEPPHPQPFSLPIYSRISSIMSMPVFSVVSVVFRGFRMLSVAFGLEGSRLVLIKQIAVEIRRPYRPTIYWSPPRKQTQYLLPLVVLAQPERSGEMLELGKLRNIMIPPSL
jgi:hypothetical protein